MKGIFLLFTILMVSSSLYAQWTNTTNVTNTNTGNVGIGSGTAFTPQMKFEVIGSGQIIRNTPANNYTTLRLYNDQNLNVRSLEIDYSGSQYTGTLVTGGPTGESASIATTGAYPLVFGTSNTARMTINALGNVGIGNINPTSKVSITGVDWHLDLNNTQAGGSTWRLGSSADGWGVGAGKFIISPSSASLDAAFVIDGQKRVGIGTVTPAATLDVHVPLPAQGTYASQNWSSGDAGYNLRLQTVWNAYGITQKFVQKFGGTDYPVLAFYQGRIGMGVTNPSDIDAILKVQHNLPTQGTYDFQNWSSGDAGYNFRLQTVWNNYGITQKFVQRFGGTDYSTLAFYQGRVGIGIDNPGNISYKLDVNGVVNATGFYVNGVPISGTGSSQWTTSGTNINYNTAGMVSIGTATAPAGYKLAVGGKIVAEEIVVKLQSNWPDYVFESGYKLPSLSELEKFIVANKHLPGVPTAGEVKEDGVKVGEMEAILLKKVEELTLYLIEANKQIDHLRREVDQLKAKR